MPSQPRLLKATGSDEPRHATDVTSRTNPGFLFISVFVCFYRFEGSQFEIALKLQKDFQQVSRHIGGHLLSTDTHTTPTSPISRNHAHRLYNLSRQWRCHRGS